MCTQDKQAGLLFAEGPKITLALFTLPAPARLDLVLVARQKVQVWLVFITVLSRLWP